ncbi:MAG: TIGR00730 family Rossman fold protein [Candidatus Limivicinus sp.]
MKICIYGASSDRLEKEYFDAAAELGRLIAESGSSLVFGGGQGGLMGACAKSAGEAGGEVIGIIPKFFDEPGILYQGCTRVIYTENMRQRKEAMEKESEAFIALPGGIGTFDELFEIMTLKQLGRHSKPIALLNTLSYYTPLCSVLESTAEKGFMSRSCFKLFALYESPAGALQHVLSDRPVTGSLRKICDYSK